MCGDLDGKAVNLEATAVRIAVVQVNRWALKLTIIINHVKSRIDFQVCQ
jgi:hypothetical protein